MNKIEIIELFNKNNIDTVGIAPIGPYEELKKVLEDKVNKNLITGMEEPDIEKRINPKLIMEDASSIIVCAIPYYVGEKYESNIDNHILDSCRIILYEKISVSHNIKKYVKYTSINPANSKKYQG